MARYHVRCANKKCDMRRVLRKHPDEYRVVPKCSGCGGVKYYLSHWMNRRKVVKCYCPGYMHCSKNGEWPHQQGSTYCHYRKDGTLRVLGDPDFRDARYEELMLVKDLTCA